MAANQTQKPCDYSSAVSEPRPTLLSIPDGSRAGSKNQHRLKSTGFRFHTLPVFLFKWAFGPWLRPKITMTGWKDSHFLKSELGEHSLITAYERFSDTSKPTETV